MAFEPVFADTSFFFALAAMRDAVHRESVSVFAALLRKRRRIVTTDYVLDEALTLTKARANARVAVSLLERIERSDTIDLEMVGSARFELAKSFFCKYADRGYSFTDCTSIILIRELRIKEVLTTDGHFIEAGFRALLPVS